MKQNFEVLKKALDVQTRLYLRKPGLPWRIITDASHHAVGGVLEQKEEDDNWHPVAFYSWKHIEWEVKYRATPNTEFQPASAFTQDINDIWRAYNKKHGIDLQLSDISCILAQSAQGSQLDPEFCNRFAIQTNQVKEWKAMVAEFEAQKQTIAQHRQDIRGIGNV